MTTINKAMTMFFLACSLAPASGKSMLREVSDGQRDLMGAPEVCTDWCTRFSEAFPIYDFSAGNNGQGIGQCLEVCALCANPGQGNNANCVCAHWDTSGVLEENGWGNRGDCFSDINEFCRENPTYPTCTYKHRQLEEPNRELHGGAAEFCDNICEQVSFVVDVDFTAGNNGEGNGQCNQACANCLNPGQGNAPNCICQELEATGAIAEGVPHGQCVAAVTDYCRENPHDEMCDRKNRNLAAVSREFQKTKRSSLKLNFE